MSAFGLTANQVRATQCSCGRWIWKHLAALLPPPQLIHQEFSHNSRHVPELRHKQARYSDSNSTCYRLVIVLSCHRRGLSLHSGMIFSIHQALVSRLGSQKPQQLQGYDQQPTFQSQLLPFLVILSNCWLNPHSSSRRAITLHALMIPRLSASCLYCGLCLTTWNSSKPTRGLSTNTRF